MSVNQLPSEAAAVIAVLDPDSYVAGTHTVSDIDMSKFHNVLVILSVGDMASTSTVDLNVKSDSASGGSYATTIASITQLTEAGSDDDKQVLVNIRSADLAEGQRYLEVNLVVAAAASECSVVVLGFDPRYAPASNHDASTVDEIVTP